MISGSREASVPWTAIGLIFAAILIGAAIAFDDVSLSSYQLRVWNLIFKSSAGLVVVGGTIGGGIRYFRDRRDRLAWDKTRFMAELFESFDDSSSHQRALKLIDQAYQSGDYGYLTRVLSDYGGRFRKRDLGDRYAIDRFLDFFDRLMTHVFITETLSKEDIASFSGYVTQIVDVPPVKAYALNWGYEDVVSFGEDLWRGTNRVALAARLDDDPHPID
jgi:hypothetical protein